ncbi:MAG: hypothetical protein O6949_04590 [Chloroflexi bacterium]|nr:hypothetical protein [Chloroflexota bacterium]
MSSIAGIRLATQRPGKIGPLTLSLEAMSAQQSSGEPVSADGTLPRWGSPK